MEALSEPILMADSVLYPSGFPTTRLLHKQRQRRRVAVEEILFADRADFAVAEKSRQTQRAEMLLHHSRVVVRRPNKFCPRPLQLHRQPP